MSLTKKSKSMFNMMKGDSEKKSDEKTDLPKIERDKKPEHDVFNMPSQEYEDDNDESQIYMFNTSEEKVVRNATDDEKHKISKEWYDLKDERIKDDDVVIIKAADMRFKSTSDIVSFTECGEPEKNQFISIDFTPEEGVDDKFLLKKCISFWQFIEKHPKLKSLRAEPEDLDYEEDSFVSRTPSPISTKSSFGLDLTATCPSSISMLASSWLKKEDLMSSCLATKTELPCKPESLEYAEYQLDKPKKSVKKKKLDLKASRSLSHAGASNLSIAQTQPSAPTAVDDFSKMMTDMRDFDIKHRDDKDPPGHPPSLIHAQMVRNESILPFIKTGRG